MRAFIAIATAFLIALNVAADQDTRTYKAVDAGRHVGQLATVVGKVAEVHRADGGHIFINLGASYPNEAFTAFVPKKAADQLGNPEKLEGHTVLITGEISLYRGKPEIVINDASQLKVRW